MDNPLDAEESAIIATYSSRRDAEVARDYLADNDLKTFVSADDAGGMHPQMQRPNGVKLIGMSSTAEEARALLEDVDLAAPVQDHTAADHPQQEPQSDGTSMSTGTVAALIIATLVVVGLLLLSLF